MSFFRAVFGRLFRNGAEQDLLGGINVASPLTLTPEPQNGYHTIGLSGTAGFGDVTGPDEAEDLNIAVYDGTTGKAIADGGATIAEVIAAASPVTTKGDLFTHNGSANARLGVGTNDFALFADSSQATGLQWRSMSGFATVSYVDAQDNAIVALIPAISGANPQPLGTAAPGATGDVSDAGHVHPLPTGADNRLVRYDGTDTPQSSVVALSDAGIADWVGVSVDIRRASSAAKRVFISDATFDAIHDLRARIVINSATIVDALPAGLTAGGSSHGLSSSHALGLTWPAATVDPRMQQAAAGDVAGSTTQVYGQDNNSATEAAGDVHVKGGANAGGGPAGRVNIGDVSGSIPLIADNETPLFNYYTVTPSEPGGGTARIWGDDTEQDVRALMPNGTRVVVLPFTGGNTNSGDGAMRNAFYRHFHRRLTSSTPIEYLWSVPNDTILEYEAKLSLYPKTNAHLCYRKVVHMGRVLYSATSGREGTPLEVLAAEDDDASAAYSIVFSTAGSPGGFQFLLTVTGDTDVVLCGWLKIYLYESDHTHVV